MPPVILDLQGTQSVDHRDRGVARYIIELARGLETVAPGVVESYLFNPDLALPGGLEPIVASGRLRATDEAVFPEGSILHIASPFELAVPFERIFPPAAREAHVRIAVTLFDLIPEIFAERYLVQPGIRRRYRTRLELVRSADMVFAISRATAADAQRLLGIPSRRIDVVELAASDHFVPAVSRKDAGRRARELVPGLAERFVLYVGGQDFRKNMEGLVEAWSRLPDATKRSYQLVLTCRLDAPTEHHFNVVAERLGLRLLVTGFVSEEALVTMNQSAELVVFPSLYEGFGLPVVEALRCGTPAIASDRSSLPEVLPAGATFDPEDPDAIAGAITRGLTDDRLRAEVLAGARSRTFFDVARETGALYRKHGRVARRPAPRRTPAPRRIGFVSPLPPVPGGVSDFSFRLLEQLRDLISVDAYVDGPPHRRTEVARAEGPEGVAVRPLAALRGAEAANGRYDTVVWTLGNSEYHTGALAGLLRRSGVVLAHEVRLTGLYRFARWQHPEAVPGGFATTLRRMYDGLLPPDIAKTDEVSAADAERFNILMAVDAIAASERFLVTSRFAGHLARLDARRHDRGKVVELPFAVGAVAGDPWPERGTEDSDPLIVTFGGMSALKQTQLLISTFGLLAPKHQRARLVFVGPANDEVRAVVDRAAEAAGVTGRVEVTGEVDAETYRAWLARAWVSLQLRTITNGESSGAAGDCFSAGLPTVITAIGAARAIPSDAAVHVPAGASAPELATVVEPLLSDPARRGALSQGALAHANRHTYRLAAEALYELVLSLPRGG